MVIVIIECTTEVTNLLCIMTNAKVIKSSALNVHRKYKKSRIFHIIACNQAKMEDHKLFRAQIVSI